MLSSPQKGFKSRREQIIHKLERSWSLNRTYPYKSFGDKQIRYVGEGTCLKCFYNPLGEILRFPRYECEWPLAWHSIPERPVSHMWVSVNDLWRDMASRKSHVSELKNWMLRQPDEKNKACLSIQFLLRKFCNLRLVDLNNYLKYV